MIAGRYALEREIGRGGMGAVWLGRDELLNRPVALKRIGANPDGPRPDLARAEREARLAASLNHPHVVAVYDLVEDGEARWLVMEYVAGDSLAAVIRDGGALRPDRAAALLAQAAEALASAHAAGIVHRDVKPSNMMVTARDQVKLTDFGIARATADASLTRTGLVTGSPGYLAPEVATGKTATDRSDVWSLGATLYHALAGRPPYDVGNNVMGTLYRIVHEDPPRLPDPGWLGPVLEATMATDPERRWSMAEVARVLAAGPRATTAGAPTPDQEQPTRPMTTLGPAAAGGAGAGAGVAGAAAAGGSSGAASRGETPPAAPETAARPEPPAGARAGSPSRPQAGRSPRRRGPSPVLLGLLALATAAVLVFALLQWLQRPDQTSVEPSSAASSASASDSASAEETADEPSEEPSQTSDGSAEAEQMEDFVRSYLATVTEDPRTTWRQLTSAFQRESGGYDQYSGYWGGIASAEMLDISADPDAGTVTYSAEYTRQDDSTFTDVVTLELVQRGDSFRISGES